MESTDFTSTDGLRIELQNDTPNPLSTTAMVVGEIDAANAFVLRDALEMACEPGRRLIVDLSGATFMDSSGVGALIATSNRASETRCAFVLQHPSREVERVLKILGLRGHFEPEEPS